MTAAERQVRPLALPPHDPAREHRVERDCGCIVRLPFRVSSVLSEVACERYLALMADRSLNGFAGWHLVLDHLSVRRSSRSETGWVIP